LILILVLVVALPIGWLVAEFTAPRWARVALGIAAICMCFGVAYVGSSLSRLNYNAWYGGATSDLIDASVEQLEAGNVDHVTATLKQLQNEYQPTYENRAHYDELVDDTVERMKEAPAAEPAP
jgi:hypothetical protein